MGIKAIFFDIDGTLRDFSTGTIRDSARAALKKAHEAGLLLFVATGRHRLEIEEEQLLDHLEFDGYVTLNGQYCYTGDQVIYDFPIAPEDVNAVLACIREEPFPCIFMEADRMYINLVDDVVMEAQAGIGTRVPPVCDVTHAAERPIYQMVPYITEEKEGWLKTRVHGCSFSRWHDNCGSDMNPLGGSKCLGIRKMGEHFGFTLEEAAAIGDGNNDVAMIREAGLGIAMGNGKEAAREAADYITDSLEQDGLLKAVLYILQKDIQEE